MTPSRIDWHFDLNFACLRKLEFDGHSLARFQGRLDVHKHDVQTAWLELDNALGGHINLLHFPHAHHIAIHDHGVQLHII
jgi:hypothetical protein